MRGMRIANAKRSNAIKELHPALESHLCKAPTVSYNSSEHLHSQCAIVVRAAALSTVNNSPVMRAAFSTHPVYQHSLFRVNKLIAYASYIQ